MGDTGEKTEARTNRSPEWVPRLRPSNWIRIEQNRASKTYAAKKHSARLLSCRPNLTWGSEMFSCAALYWIHLNPLHLAASSGLVWFQSPFKSGCCSPLSPVGCQCHQYVVFFWSFVTPFRKISKRSTMMKIRKRASACSTFVQGVGTFSRQNSQPSQPQDVGLWDRTRSPNRSPNLFDPDKKAREILVFSHILTSPSIQLLCDVDESWKIAWAFLAKWQERICASRRMFSVALTKSCARIARIPRPDNQSHRMKKIL